MKIKYFSVIIIVLIFALVGSSSAQLKKVAQSGMSYLSISLAARESAMGNASVASVSGTQSLFYNPASLTSLENFGFVINHVSWLADTQLYGLGAAYSFGQYGTVGLDMIYMDYGEIIGTQRVDKSIDERGFITTGNLNIQDYSIGISYAMPINELFSVGLKIKYVHEDLGSTPIAVKEVDAANGIYEYEDRIMVSFYEDIKIGSSIDEVQKLSISLNKHIGYSYSLLPREQDLLSYDQNRNFVEFTFPNLLNKTALPSITGKRRS